MLRPALLAMLLFATTASGSAPSIKVQTVVVKARVIDDASTRRQTADRLRRRVTRARHRRPALHARRAPRPLSPGEFGRTGRHGM